MKSVTIIIIIIIMYGVSFYKCTTIAPNGVVVDNELQQQKN